MAERKADKLAGKSGILAALLKRRMALDDPESGPQVVEGVPDPAQAFVEGFVGADSAQADDKDKPKKKKK